MGDVRNAVEAMVLAVEAAGDPARAGFEDRILAGLRSLGHDVRAAERPMIVCLCGSTRFYDAFQEANYQLTMEGKIVLSVGFYPHAKALHGHGEGVGHDSTEKRALDDLHLRKIDLADEVLVLNVGGYIGESTRREIDYARRSGKPVRWLEVGLRWTDPADVAPTSVRGTQE